MGEGKAINKKLPMKVILGYGAAALGYNFAYVMVSTYVNIYFTNVLGVSFAAAGVIMLIARFWDGFNDPMMGAFVDKTQTKHGKYRPFLIWGIIPLALTTILLFYKPAFLGVGSTQMTLYAGLIYILFGMAYTFANIPYMSMQSTLSFDPDERTKLITLKNVFMLFGVLGSMVVIPMIAITEEGISEQGFLTAAIISAVIIAITMIISFASTKNHKYVEEVNSNSEKITMKDRMNAVTQNKPLIISAISLFIISLIGALAGAGSYYFINVLNQPELVMLFSITGALSMFISMAFMPIAMKFEKGSVMTFGMVLYAISSIIMFFAPGNMTIFMICNILRGIGNGFSIIVIWAMIADCVDYAKLKTGKQQGGIVFSTSTFMQKCATGVGGGLLNGILLIVGLNTKVFTQTATAATGTLALITIIPAAFAIIIVILMKFYSLTKAEMYRINAEIDR